MNDFLKKKKTKKNIGNIDNTKTKRNRTFITNTNNELIESLLNKKNKSSFNKKVEVKKNNNINPNDRKIIQNFHQIIKSTNSDNIIGKMLDLNEKDIIKFYKNMELTIGKEMSKNIKSQISKQLVTNNNNGISNLCPFCLTNKANCVILLCGHLICNICAKNINRCKFPCPKCKKNIKYIQIISI
tara:strand:+ start:271 stop:825 length:555 start_codon:yes stop_codon:yes gene_type:complete